MNLTARKQTVQHLCFHLFLYSHRRVETFCMGAELSGFQAPCADLPQSSCCRRFCVINWFFWGSSGFISFQSQCTSSSHVCTCFLLSAAANCAFQTTIDPIRSRTYTIEMLYLYLLIKLAKASLENNSSAGPLLNLLCGSPLIQHKILVHFCTSQVGLIKNQ